MGKPKVIFHNSILIVLVILWTNRVSASPYPQLPVTSDQLSATPPSRIAPKVTVPLSLSTSSPSRPSTSLSLTGPSKNYLCYDASHGTHPITIEACRKTLAILRQFPNYRNPQEFKEGRLPALPGGITPPYLISAEDTTCELVIEARLSGVVEVFSFEQARTLATNIIVDCSSDGNPGYGGESPIGRKLGGWVVRAKGSKVDSSMNRTRLLGNFGVNNTTPVNDATLTSRSSVDKASAGSGMERT